MVNIAIAGGSGQVAREVIDAVLASKSHEITILSRSAALVGSLGINWQVVDYNNKASLIEALRGVHTLLSFVQLLSDFEQKSQINLIDAAVSAGVKRFAPSEYGSKGTVDMSWWQGKQVIREYLEKLNEHGDVLEYTLFQPGFFLDYLAYPHKSAKYLDPLQSVFNFEHRRAITIEGHDPVVTLTTVADLAAIVARAIDYEGTWPRIGGIRGNRLTFSQVLEIGRTVRGRSFDIDKVKIDDLEAGNLSTSWGLEAVHHAVPTEQAPALLKTVTIGFLLSSTKGAWDSSDAWNQRFPEYQFTSAEDFLASIWLNKV